MRTTLVLLVICVGSLLSLRSSGAAYIYSTDIPVGSGWETQRPGAVDGLILANGNALTTTSTGLFFDFANSGSIFQITDLFSPDAQYICFNSSQGACSGNPEDGSILKLPP